MDSAAKTLPAIDGRICAAILSVSLLTIMASAAISPAMAQIGQAFPGTNKTVVKLILTLPSLLIIPFSLLSGWLATRIRKRTILVWGLGIYCVAGAGGGLAQSIGQLLVIRAVLGVGIGLIMPLSTTLIADFFEQDARTRMMGLSGAVNNVGGVVFLSVSGWLACISWRWAFSVYALSLITLLLTPCLAAGASGPGRQRPCQTEAEPFRVPVRLLRHAHDDRVLCGAHQSRPLH